MADFSGKVIRGQQLGRRLGFPTANLSRNQFMRLKEKPRFGIWAGYAAVGKKTYAAGIVIGPLDKKGLPKLEAHLLNFNGSLYGRQLKLVLKKFIRSYRKFNSLPELRAQIEKDFIKIKAIL